MVLYKSKDRVHLPKFQPRLNIQEFNALTDLLFEACKEKHATCARLLGISRPTWKRWEKTPPDWPWWNLVLRHVIKEYLAAMSVKGGMTSKHRKGIRRALAEIPHADEMDEEISALATNLGSAQRHLRLTLGGKGMFFDELRLPANSGGFSEKALRKAARAINVIKTQEGYGNNKRSYWRLPTEYDD